MVRTLYILRHAKSSWDDPSLRDFDRPLNKRGREGAQLIGNYLKSEGVELSRLISSPALRTRQTIELLLKSSGITVEPRFDERIYEADLRRLLQVISEIDEDVESVMLVGHNPGMEQLLECLTLEPHNMPTAALGKISIPVAWRSVTRGIGELNWFVTPKSLVA
jgi:phosphohistidine phosphatase